MQIVSVLIPLGLPGPYDYAVPPNMSVRVGDFVRVPLGPRRVNGVVWSAPRSLGADDLEPKKIKSILEHVVQSSY